MENIRYNKNLIKSTTEIYSAYRHKSGFHRYTHFQFSIDEDKRQERNSKGTINLKQNLNSENDKKFHDYLFF